MSILIRLKIILIIIVAIILNMTVVASAGSDAATVSCKLSIDASHITISGNITSGANQNVTMLIINLNGELIYVNQIMSGGNGTFSQSVVLEETAVDGTYTVKVGGAGVKNPAKMSFDYRNQGIQIPENVEISVYADIIGDKIIIEGAISAELITEVSIFVIAPDGNTAFTKSCTTDANGSYNIELDINSKFESGIYTIKAENKYAESIAATKLLYAKPLEAKNISKSENEALYNALKSARASLDFDNDGTMTA